jgi:cytochrome c-type biogenesis protein CcmH
VFLAALLIVGGSFAACRAVEPDEVLKDPAMETRARRLSTELRCLVCQNQSIDDSNAPLARDLRLLVREQLTAGKSDAQVLDHIVQRYGEFVLLRPRLSSTTVLLWLAPVLLLLGGLVAVFGMLRNQRRPTRDLAPLTPDEQARLDDIMKSRDR